MKRKTSNLFLLAAVIIAAATTATVQAQNTWLPAAGGSWGTSGNWSAGVPLATDNIVIGNTAAAPISLDVNGVGNTLLTSNTAALTITGSGANRTLNLTGAATIAGSGSVTIGSSTANQGVSLTATTLTKTGSGQLEILNASTIGNVFLENGTTIIRDAASLGTTGTITLGAASGSNAATLRAATLTLAKPIVLGGTTGTLTVNNLGFFSPTYSGGITGTNNLRLESVISGGSGGITFNTGSINHTGTLTIANVGTATANNVTGTVNVDSLIGSNVTNVSVSDATLNGSGITKGAQVVIFNNTGNAYTGTTTVNTGATLRLAISNVLPDGGGKGDITINGTLDLRGDETINGLSGAGVITRGTAGTSTLTVGGNNASSTFAGTLQNGSGTLALLKTGSGVLALTGTNLHTGGVSIGSTAGGGGGTIRVNSTAALGGGSANLVSNTTAGNAIFASTAAGTLATGRTVFLFGSGGGITFGDSVGTGDMSFVNIGRATGGTDRTINVANSGQTVTFTGNLTDTGSNTSSTTFFKGGAGTLTILGTGNTEVGYSKITVTGGTLNGTKFADLGVVSSFGKASAASATGLITLDGGAIGLVDGGSSSSTNRALQIGSTTAGGTGTILNNATSNTLSFTNAALTYGTTNQTRSLTLGGSNTGANTFATAIGDNGTGAVSLSKTGNGTWVLSAATHGYTGATTITAGKLVIDGNISTSVSTSVSGTGTLGGIGTVGALTVSSGGTLAPGNSPGILNTGDISLESGSTLSMELYGATVGGGYDQLNVTGSVSLEGALAVTMGFTPVNNTLFFIIANDGLPADTISGRFSNASLDGGTYIFGGQEFQISYFGDTETNSFDGGNDVVLKAVPEPAPAILLGGVGLLCLLRRRRN